MLSMTPYMKNILNLHPELNESYQELRANLIEYDRQVVREMSMLLDSNKDLQRQVELALQCCRQQEDELKFLRTKLQLSPAAAQSKKLAPKNSSYLDQQQDDKHSRPQISRKASGTEIQKDKGQDYSTVSKLAGRQNFNNQSSIQKHRKGGSVANSLVTSQVDEAMETAQNKLSGHQKQINTLVSSPPKLKDTLLKLYLDTDNQEPKSPNFTSRAASPRNSTTTVNVRQNKQLLQSPTSNCSGIQKKTGPRLGSPSGVARLSHRKYLQTLKDEQAEQQGQLLLPDAHIPTQPGIAHKIKKQDYLIGEGQCMSMQTYKTGILKQHNDKVFRRIQEFKSNQFHINKNF